MEFFLVNLFRSEPKIEEYAPDDIDASLKFYGLNNAMQLNDINWKVFDSKLAARDWLSKFQIVKKTLDNDKICLSRTLPGLLTKRRFLIQALMGEKLSTERVYFKNWPAGTLINLYDQTFFLTVQIISIEKIASKRWRYTYQLPQKDKKHHDE